MSKKFTSIVVTMLAMLVLLAVPASAQRPDPKTMKSQVLNKTQFDQKALRNLKKVPTLSKDKMPLPNGKFIRQTKIKRNAGINNAALNPLIGHMTYNQSWDSEGAYGLYSIMPQAPTNYEPVMLHNYLGSGNGGAIIDNKYYVNYFIEFWGYLFYYNDCFDLETGELLYDNSDVDIIDMAICSSYDNVTGLSYGIYYDETGAATQICSYDYPTLTRNVIGTTTNEYLVCAADGKGSLFAITFEGALYKIDLSNGSETFVGNTGLAPYYLQSACIDPTTGVFYWAYLDQAGSGLFQVNTETAEAAEIFPFDGLVEIVQLQAQAPDADVAAPAAVENLKLEVAADAPQNLTVSFDMPTATVGEEPLEGTLQYTIDLNGEDFTGDAQPGEKVSRLFENLEAGTYTVVVRASNAAGKGASAKASIWVGFDEVAAPATASLVVDENLVATVTWDAVTEGIHGGVVNPSEVTYKVTRCPDNVVVAEGISETTFSETLEADPLRLVYYQVSAMFQGKVGAPTATNSVKVGNPLVPSYSYDFNGSEDGLWTIVDTNNDGYTWNMASGYAYYQYNYSGAADDWLLTPPLALKAGKKYLLSFDTYAASTYYPELIEVSVGKGMEFDTYDNVIAPTDVLWTDPQQLSGMVTVDEDGTYYVGFHAISEANMWNLYVANFALIDGDTPGLSDNIVVTPGELGALNATITFNAPTKTSGGDELGDLTKVEVYREGVLVATIDNPQKGEAQTVFDDGMTESKIYNYSIVAYNSIGRGPAATASAFIGMDVPGAPQNIKMVDNAPGITLSWDPVSTVGANGGYVDPSQVYYAIYGVSGGYLGDLITTTAETTYVDPSVDINNMEPSFYQLVVQSVNETGASGYYVGALVAGAPEPLPFVDSFGFDSQGNLEHFWTSTTPATSTTGWTLYSQMSSDGDNSCGLFQASEAGDASYLTTPRISFEGAAAPVAVFKYYIAAGMDITLSLTYNKQDGNGDILLAEVANGQDFTTEGWRTAVVDLSPLIGSTGVLISYYAEANQPYAYVLFDEMRFGDVYAEDIAVTGVTAPRAVQVSETVDVNVSVQNNGSNDVEAGSYTVKLYAGDKVVGETTETPALAAYAGKGIVTIPYTAKVTDASPLVLKAEVEYAKDLDPLNNSAQTNINVRQNKVPTINDLTATTSGYQAVQLTWGEPAEPQGVQGQLITEDFEDTDIYQDCDNGGTDAGVPEGHIGQWTVYNADGAISYGWSSVTIPGQDIPKAWIVFRPENYFDLEEGGSLVPYSGDQYMLSLDAAGDPIPTTDDWLISPELSGNAQTISFFTTEITSQYGNEVFEVLYSTTDTNIESFEKLYDGTASEEWVEVSVDLPEGAKYFAIRNHSYDAFGLMVDDVTYEATAAVAAAKGADLEVTGYNVYRDGELVASVGADVHEYVDVADVDGLHTYNVTVLYGTVESPMSNTVSVVTAIDELKVTEGLNDADITVYGANGAIIASGRGVYNALRTGVYVINNNETGDVMGVSKK